MDLKGAVIADGGGKILIVEQDPVFGSTMAASLAPLGHTCLVVSDPMVAIRYIHDFCPDVVLMDPRFPRAQELAAGVEWREFLLLNILQCNQSAGMRFIVISEDASPVARDQALAAGASDFLAKPLNFATLVRGIQSVLSKALVL
jgi:CheY-like chemotaxis protein